MSCLGKKHWEVMKWILRYLRGTADMSLCFRDGGVQFKDFVDADFAGNIDNRRSTTGYVCTVGSTVMSWVKITRCCGFVYHKGVCGNH